MLSKSLLLKKTAEVYIPDHVIITTGYYNKRYGFQPKPVTGSISPDNPIIKGQPMWSLVYRESNDFTWLEFLGQFHTDTVINITFTNLSGTSQTATFSYKADTDYHATLSGDVFEFKKRLDMENRDVTLYFDPKPEGFEHYDFS